MQYLAIAVLYDQQDLISAIHAHGIDDLEVTFLEAASEFEAFQKAHAKIAGTGSADFNPYNIYIVPMKSLKVCGITPPTGPGYHIGKLVANRPKPGKKSKS